MKHIRTTIAALRARCPFSKVDQNSIHLPIPKLDNVNDAVRHYQRPRDFFTSAYYLGLAERADYQGAPPEMRLFVWRFMRALRKRGLPFYVHTCYRSPAEQLKAYQAGNSTLKSGAHQRACAVDIVSAIDHWQVPEDLWYYVGTLGEAVARDTQFGPSKDRRNPTLKIEWGGRWKKFPDPAHWQLSDWSHRAPVQTTQKLAVNPYSDEMRFG